MFKDIKSIFYPLVLLLIPWLAMKFSDKVDWSAFDFMVMGFLLLSLGLGLHVVCIKGKNFKQRNILIILLIFLFILIWAELAVGLFGTPFSGT
ncbi:MAG: hypothetical protein EBS74_00870 [Flavobacteriia bacterium]|nr:hypothetical protein [Flavobacteriia bacterium]